MSLPLEIWLTIFESTFRDDKQTLLSLALVSRAFHGAVLPLLYSDVQITGRERQQRFYRWIQSESPSNPALYIREYTIIITNSDVASGKPYTHNSGALARMQHLRKLTLLGEPDDGKFLATNTILQSEDPSWSLPELRELRWADRGIELELCRFFLRCPAIEHLELPQWAATVSPPTGTLSNLRSISGDGTTAVAFLCGRHIVDIELTSAVGLVIVDDYFTSNPDSAARIRSFSIPPLYFRFEEGHLESILLHLPHLKQLRMGTTQSRKVESQTDLLRGLEKLVLYNKLIGTAPHFKARMRISVRHMRNLSSTPLGRGNTKPCLELWDTEYKMLLRWRRSEDGTRLELVK
ncbi:hypothetical protein CYLTODRAFT_492488 [Cylindrobasidium torrendii FP15055 ss-10]|uniref:Uncharacterized protein n=1 Tax=Cylindrobasidium torrendii FP15055 ss-10 TaxID=1314674 RepID=A0A0D7B4U8_9AGAR|nr:hypothetical protein CYLTODRAFT_492488 [Cylindrobasidium torrendii FP15055 ss-10]